MINIATIEGMRRYYIQEEARQSRHEQRAVETFGPDLGNAYFRYAEGKDDAEDGTSALDAFAEAVVSATENGTHQDKVAALKAVLLAFEFKLDKVDAVASRAASSSARY